jgi:CheY-like chemotaxis protein
MDKRIFVLIVEDDDVDKFLLEEFFLEKYPDKIRFETVKNGRELLDFLNTASNLPDVILSDLNMPQVDGFEALKIIKHDERFKHIPYIISSTSFSDEELKSTTQLGADKYLRKPQVYKEYHLIYDAIRELVK